MEVAATAFLQAWRGGLTANVVGTTSQVQPRLLLVWTVVQVMVPVTPYRCMCVECDNTGWAKKTDCFSDLITL